jgi:hypothetical protein
LIGANGDNVGVVSIQEAMRLANEADLDLVEVAPNSEPPVCRVMDFGKFLYEKTKKERDARRAQTNIEVKEIRFRPKTNAVWSWSWLHPRRRKSKPNLYRKKISRGYRRDSLSRLVPLPRGFV